MGYQETNPAYGRPLDKGAGSPLSLVSYYLVGDGFNRFSECLTHVHELNHSARSKPVNRSRPESFHRWDQLYVAFEGFCFLFLQNYIRSLVVTFPNV